MGLFSNLNRKANGMLNMIRCDLQDYLVWHWTPANGNEGRSNAVRFGSSLRVRDGEVAVFVYRQSSGISQEFIYGPYDGFIETKNFPILADILSKVYGGGTPFQADIYFINLAGVIQMRFGIPYANTSDPRFPDFVVPVCGGGTMSFRISDVKQFIAKHRMIGFDIEDLKSQVRQIVERTGKSCIANAPYKYQVPLNQIERCMEDVSLEMERRIAPEMQDFGIEMTRWDLNRLEPDYQSEGWRKLLEITRGRQEKVYTVKTEVEVQNLRDMQAINKENLAETMRIQREELQRAQRLQSETSYIGAHALNRQADVLQTAAENLGTMTSMGGGEGGGAGMNPAGMMAGMMMGGSVASQFSNMMSQMNGNMGGMGGPATPPPMPGQQPATPPPPPPQASFHISVNGQASGPFDLTQLAQLVASGGFTPTTYVWRPGMSGWEQASAVPETAALFTPGVSTVPPPPPNIP